MTERSSVSGPAPARILLAHDLSAGAERAADLLASTRWPASTLVRIVTSPVGIGPLASSFAYIPEARAHGRAVRETIALAHERVASVLAEAGLRVETSIISGKPGTAIPAEAARVGADLVIVGARPQSGISAALVGSVSRAVVERAPCSVLVARDSTVKRVLLATDGSPAARLATTIVATSPLFADARVVVVGVGDGTPAYPGIVLDAAEQRAALPASEASAGEVVGEAVRELSAAGREVESRIHLGAADREVVSAARAWPADMVVLGWQGESLLRRLVLGSVPRRVLDEVDASVLVARADAERASALDDED